MFLCYCDIQRNILSMEFEISNGSILQSESAVPTFIILNLSCYVTYGLSAHMPAETDLNQVHKKVNLTL